jgi:hypothetical protein
MNVFLLTLNFKKKFLQNKQHNFYQNKKEKKKKMGIVFEK